MNVSRIQLTALAIAACTAGILLAVNQTHAHCDTLDGPVVADARKALDTRDVSPALKWVRPEDEAAIREVFRSTLTVREQGGEARELADRFFFETLVRIHRAGEGAPYTGLKPAGTPVEPAIREADEALASGSDKALIEHLTRRLAEGVHERFERAMAASKQSDASVEAGRAYVESYVEFVHYVEALDRTLSGPLPAHTQEHSSVVNEHHEH